MNRLQMIFENQQRLMDTLIPVEKEIDSNIYIPEKFPINLHDRGHQRYLRELGNRLIEELGETLVASEQSSREEFREEMIDVLHFITEFSIVVDFNPVDYINKNYNLYMFNLNEYTDDLDYYYQVSDSMYIPYHNENDIYVGFLKQYGKMMNCFRSKPWKRVYDETDERKFYFELSYLWRWFFQLMKHNGLGPNEIWDLYKEKNKVNFERQENGY